MTSNLVTPPPGPLEHPAFVDGARRLAKQGLPLDVWAYHTQLPHVIDAGQAVPELTIVVDHVGGPLGIGPFARQAGRGLPEWKQRMLELAALPNVRVKLGGLTMYVNGFDFHQPAEAAGLGGAGEDLAALHRDLHRGVRRRPLHVREQLPGRQGHVQLSGPVERLQAPDGGGQCGGEDGAVQRHRHAHSTVSTACRRHWPSICR